MSTWPQGSPVFGLTICPSPSKAHLHSATHGHADGTSNCFGDQGWISHSSGCEEELYKWYEEDVGVWRQEITPRCANKWLILDWQRNTVCTVLTSYFLPGQTGAWANHHGVWVKRSKAGIASLLTPPQNQREAGREKHTDMQTEWIERGGQRERERQREKSERCRRYIWLCGCVKYQGMHHNCVFFLERSDGSLQDNIGLTKCVILYFKTAGAVSAQGDIFKDRMETVFFLMPQGFH